MLSGMSELPLTGGCLCGGVRYEIAEPLISAGYCHCTRCQRRAGVGAAISARVVPGSFRVTHGEELLRSWVPTGGGNAKAFCTVCGSGVMAYDPGNPELMGVRLGTIDGDPGIRPSYHQHLATAAVWEALPDDGLPRFEGQAPSPPR
jgi:hypothetical protein